MLHDKYLFLVESNKQQIEEVRSKIPAENSETRTTSKRVWICSMRSAYVAFSWQEDKNEEVIQKFIKSLVRILFIVLNRVFLQFEKIGWGIV